jgi:hypothetical protein
VEGINRQRTQGDRKVKERESDEEFFINLL